MEGGADSGMNRRDHIFLLIAIVHFEAQDLAGRSIGMTGSTMAALYCLSVKPIRSQSQSRTYRRCESNHRPLGSGRLAISETQKKRMTVRAGVLQSFGGTSRVALGA
jgi:hypothetical protein